MAATGDLDHLRSSISGGLGCLALACVLSVAVLALCAGLAPWTWILRSQSDPLVQEAFLSGFAMAACFGLYLMSSGLQKVFLGLQRSHEAHLSMTLGNLITLLFLLAASQAQWGVPALVLVSSIGFTLSAVTLLGQLVRQRLLSFRGIGATTRSEWQHIGKIGGLFLVMQIAGVVGMGADNLVIGATLGASQVAAFALVQRLFSFASIPAAMINQPLWGAYAHAHASGDKPFIVKTLRGSLMVTAVVTGTLALVLAWAGPFLIAKWSSQTVQVPSLVLQCFAFWVIIESLAVAFSMFMNGCQLIKPQVYSSLLFCLLSVPLKFVFAAQWGLAGIVCCTILCFTIASPLLYMSFFRQAISASLVGPHGHHPRPT